jgi:hypothetical protein
VTGTRNEQLAGLDIRSANETGSRDSRGLTQMGDKKVGRSKTTPVRATDLAMKARVRDANLDVRQREQSAKGQVYRLADQSRQRPRSGQTASKKAGGEKNRITPVSRTGNRQSSGPAIRAVANAPSRTAQGRASTVGKQQPRNTVVRQTQGRVVASTQQPRHSAPARQPSSRAVTSQARQQPRKVVSAPVQKPQSGVNRSPQRSKQVAATSPRPARNQQKTNSSKNSSKRSRSDRSARR